MSKKKVAIALIALVILAVIIAVSVYFSTKSTKSSKNVKTAMEFYRNGAVATDAKECSNIGIAILKEGGHAVDAAIGSLICTGVVNFHSTGIGGGGFMTIYNNESKESEVYDYREVGPASLTETTFYDGIENSNKVGGKAVGVPGELRGLKKAHDKYGKLTWSRLIQPSIELAEKGTRIGKHMFANMKSSSTSTYISNDKGLKELLFKSNGEMKNVDDIVVNTKYAETLKKVAKNYDAINNGSLTAGFVKDVNDNGGNMTEEDLRNYKVKVKKAIKVNLGNGLTLHTSPLPGGGSVLVHILNMMKGYNFTRDSERDLTTKILTYHRLAEIFKFSYSMRPHLGDPDTVPAENQTKFEEEKNRILDEKVAEEQRIRINDSSTQKNDFYDPFFVKQDGYGTTHVSVLDKDGNAVAATDTINYAFGAKFRSNTSGIIFNNELADYFLNSTYKGYPTPLFNSPKAGRRPLSSTCPSIITNEKGEVVMVVGGSGGTRITLSTAWVIMKKLWFSYTLKDAIDDPRVQHTFSPSYIRNEKGVPLPKDIQKGLSDKGHKVVSSRLNAIIQGIWVDEEKKIYAYSDPRKEGVAAGY